MVVRGLIVVLATAGCREGPVACDLTACGIAPGEEPANANALCSFSECDDLLCLSFREDGAERTPFCTTDCAPAAGCDASEPGTCADPWADCPRDANGNRGVCYAVLQGLVEPGNCMAGTREARCACVPCCELDPALCDAPSECP